MYGYKLTADPPPTSFQNLLIARYGTPTVAATRPDYLFVAKALATVGGGFTNDKSYFVSPFSGTFLTALVGGICESEAGQFAQRNELIDELDLTFTDPVGYVYPPSPPPTSVAKSTELGQAAQTGGVPYGAWIATENTNSVTNPPAPSAMNDNCINYGCREGNYPN